MRYTLCAILLAASAAQAQDIDIKGLKLGMSRAEVAAVMPDPLRFTIAGVRPRYDPTTRYDASGKLDTFQWMFTPNNYEAVRDAFRAKYPDLKCTQSVVQNGFGATFPQESCRIGDISIERYSGDSADVGSVLWWHYTPEAASRDL